MMVSAIKSFLFFVFCYAIFEQKTLVSQRHISCLCPVSCQYEKAPSSFLNGALAAMWLRIEVDAVGYPNEHVAVGDAVVLGHAHADAVASRVNHRLEVSR